MPPEHGTTSRYRYGCRCEGCSQAKKDYRKRVTKHKTAPKPKRTITCDICGLTIEARPRQKRCSNNPQCRALYWRDKWRRQHAHLWGIIGCQSCHSPFDTGPIRPGRSPKLCPDCFHPSKKSTAAAPISCTVCGAATTRPLYCSERCGALGKKIGLRKRKRQRLLSGLCARHGTSGHCAVCHARNFEKYSKRRGPEGARGPTKSKVEIRKLCEQQKWKCSLCGEKLDPKIPGTHNMGISIDHVIPVSQGGTHDLANLAVAHRICNSIKGNRSLGPEQLRMIG